MDYTNEDGFRIIADFDPERKKQKELGDSAFKYTIKQPGGMIN